MKKLNQLILLITAICSLNASAQTIPSYVPTTGLVGWWPFNGNANDESGNGNNGTVYGANLTTDRLGATNKAFLFNNNYIIIPYNSIFDFNDFTISLWLSTSQTSVGVAIKQNNYLNATNERFSVALNSPSSAKVEFAVKYNIPSCNAGLGWQSNSKTQPIFNNQFHHIVGTVNGNTTKLYIDGLLVNTLVTPYIQSSACYGGDIQFGREWSSFPLYFIGKLDDIGIWNRALTDCEIKKLYNSGSGLTLSTSSSTICLGESKVLSASGATNYLWNNGATTSSITVTPTVSTVYTVTTTYSVGCTDMRTVNVTVNPCTGINESENSQLLSIFPNPAKTEININTDINYSSLVIVNSLGQVLLKKEKMDALSIESLSNGVYFIQLLNNENKVIAIKKFIKE
jgi:hypothetical protein